MWSNYRSNTSHLKLPLSLRNVIRMVTLFWIGTPQKLLLKTTLNSPCISHIPGYPTPVNIHEGWGIVEIPPGPWALQRLLSWFGRTNFQTVLTGAVPDETGSRKIVSLLIENPYGHNYMRVFVDNATTLYTFVTTVSKEFQTPFLTSDLLLSLRVCCCRNARTLNIWV